MKFSDYDYHSAQKRSAEKIGQTLRWLYKWEVSSRQVLSELLEIERSATYQTLSKVMRIIFLVHIISTENVFFVSKMHDIRISEGFFICE